MVDVDRRIPASHSAGLRRLSSRAAAASPSPRAAASPSFTPFSSSLISTFKLANIPLSPGLSESELILIESNLNFTFPPDLRSLLSLAVPSSRGFPNWRSLPALPALFHLPSLSLSIQLFAGPTTATWPTSSWGPRPHDPNLALATARSNLKRAPLLIPLFGRCYLPSRPPLAGNPVFYVDESRVFCCALDLKHFFSSVVMSNNTPGALLCKNPRWIEFWTDVADSSSSAASRRRRSSSTSCSSSGRVSCSSSTTSTTDSGPDPESFVEIRPTAVRRWVGKYMEEIGSALREGGWRDEEVEEMVHVSEACSSRLECEGIIRDVVAMRAERLAEDMRRAGWRAEEVDDLLGLDFFGSKMMRKKKRAVKLPPEIQSKVESLAKQFLE